MNDENLENVYFLENKRVSSLRGVRYPRTRGEKMKDSLRMLLKTNVEKMSVIRLETILMKTNEL